MPPAAEIEQYLTGVWRMMTGRPDGVRLLDISVDGFWNSFAAILLAMPVMLAGAVPVANEIADPSGGLALRFSILLRLAAADLAAWVVPLALFVFVAPHAGLRERIVPYVVASNWGSALLLWLVAPPVLVGLFFPGARELVALLSLVFFLAAMVLAWRLTDAAIAKGPVMASAVFAGLFIASTLVLLGGQRLLGVSYG